MDTPEKELLTAEDFESIYSSILDEFGEKAEESREEEEKEELSEEPAQTDPDRDAYADKQNYAPPVKKDNSIRNLIVLIILELLGIAGVAAWWILYLL